MWQSVLQKQGSCRRTWGIATHQNSATEALYFAGLVKIRFSLILFIYYSLSITPCAYWDFSNISTGKLFFLILKRQFALSEQNFCVRRQTQLTSHSAKCQHVLITVIDLKATSCVIIFPPVSKVTCVTYSLLSRF